MVGRNLIIVALSIVFITTFLSCGDKGSEQTVAERTSQGKVDNVAKEGQPSSKEASDKGKTNLPEEKPLEEENFTKAPMFKGFDLVSGKEISLLDYKDHVLIIDFWASWCPPCRMEVPGFIELQNKYTGRRFSVIGISVDNKEEAVKKFIVEQGINYPVIMANRQILSDYEKALGQPIRSIPTTLIVDRKGNIVSVHIGFVDKEKFDQEINPLL